MKNRKNKKGFTIVELVIVIGVIGILSAILIPTFANLTSKAQESAAKEQVSNAYTAYMMEANDGVYDGIYGKTGTADPVLVALAQKGQDKVAMKLNDTFYTYSSEKGWHVHDFTSAPTQLVAASHDSYWTNKEGTAAADENHNTAQKLSTFNSVVVYVNE